jgi:DNA repair protein RadD
MGERCRPRDIGRRLGAHAVITLHPFQQDAVAEIERHIAEGRRRLLLVAPTGSGKTVIASELIRRLIAQYRRVLFLAHRREIIDQTGAKLTANGVRHGIIMSQVDPRPMEAVQVASIDTLLVRGVRSSAMDLPPADLLVFDEAHRARGRTREHLLSLYPNAVLLGMTATPCRSDGRGLGNLFDVMIEAPQVAELIAGGYLVKSRVHAPIDPNLKGVRVEKGDYVISQLAGRMNTAGLVGDIVEHWHKYGEQRRTVAFAVDVAHSVAIRNQFLSAGVTAEHLDGETPLLEREAILARLASGETKVVSNCAVLTEGWVPAGRLRHSRAPYEADGAIPADDRARAAPRRGQALRRDPRPFRRRISPRSARGPCRLDARCRRPRRNPGAG